MRYIALDIDANSGNRSTGGSAGRAAELRETRVPILCANPGCQQVSDVKWETAVQHHEESVGYCMMFHRVFITYVKAIIYSSS